jgi:hypothetical protein
MWVTGEVLGRLLDWLFPHGSLYDNAGYRQAQYPHMDNDARYRFLGMAELKKKR